MKNRKLLIWLVTGLLLLSLAGCSGGKNISAEYADPMAPSLDRYDNNMVSKEDPELSDANVYGQNPVASQQKLIQTVTVRAETEAMDALLQDISGRITALNGYIESQEVYHGSSSTYYRNRYANLTVRIPAQQLEEFLTGVGSVSNVVSTSKSTENVTLSYVATQSRLEALEVEHARLLELMDQAKNLEDLLTVEKRLTEVRAELETVTSQLRLYDNLVDYATVHLNITEVVEYTEPVTEPETLWDRITEGFVQGVKNMGIFFEGLLVFMISAIPYLLPFGLIALVVILIIRASVRKRRAKAKAKTEDTKE